MNTSIAYNIGSDIAQSIINNTSGQDIVEALQDAWVDDIGQILEECKTNYMSYSPFEFVAHEINEQDNADELWQAFDSGFSDKVTLNMDTLKALALDTVTDLIQHELDDMEENNSDSYDEMLLDCNGYIEIGSLSFDPARVLKELDPVAYREGYLDYINCLATDNDEIEKLEETKDKINAS